LITLTGPGGTGKTRLALQIAAEMLETFVDGVFFVPLASVTEPSLVISAIAQALGLRDAGGSVRNSLRHFLRDKQLLLVLDNFEHLLPAALLLPELLAESPALKMLVTSREVLRLSGEHCLAVPPLQLPPSAALPALKQLSQCESVRLFIERAEAVASGFELTSASAPAVAEICRRLDGLPLAIELAAARMRHLAPGALLPRMERRLSMLTGGARDLSPRQQTLRGAIAWSYDLLNPDEQALFRRFAVFAGRCTLEAIEAVCVGDFTPGLRPAISIDVLDGVASLVDKSLLRHEAGAGGEPRYSMLETVREYGWEQLIDAREERQAQTRHAAYFEALAQRAVSLFHSPEQLTRLAQIDDALDDLRLVLLWLSENEQRERGQLLAGSLWFFWTIHGPVSEGREWLTRLLGGPPGRSTAPRARARALLALGLCAQRQWDLVAAEEALTESLAIARAAGDTWTAAMALVRLAWAAEVAGPFRSSARRDGATTTEHTDRGVAQLYEASTASFRQLGDAWGLAACLVFHAHFLVARDSVRARELAGEALGIARRLGDRWTLATSLTILGRLAIDARELAEARRLLEQSAVLSSELKDRYNEINTLGLLAQLELETAGFEAALALYERCAANHRLLGSRLGLAVALHDVAITARLVGDYDRAEQAYQESVELYEELGLSGEAAAVRASLGHLHMACGATAVAAATFAESLLALRSQRTDGGIATVLAGLGALALDAGAPTDAARLLGAAEALLERMQTAAGGVVIRLQSGSRAANFRRDTSHIRELRAYGRDMFTAMGMEAFESALRAGRALSTAEAVALALEPTE
jgi:predicted ATPase